MNLGKEMTGRVGIWKVVLDKESVHWWKWEKLFSSIEFYCVGWYLMSATDIPYSVQLLLSNLFSLILFPPVCQKVFRKIQGESSIYLYFWMNVDIIYDQSECLKGFVLSSRVRSRSPYFPCMSRFFGISQIFLITTVYVLYDNVFISCRGGEMKTAFALRFLKETFTQVSFRFCLFGIPKSQIHPIIQYLWDYEYLGYVILVEAMLNNLILILFWWMLRLNWR